MLMKVILTKLVFLLDLQRVTCTVTLCGNGRKMPVFVGDADYADSTYFYDVKKTDSNLLVAVGTT